MDVIELEAGERRAGGVSKDQAIALHAKPIWHVHCPGGRIVGTAIVIEPHNVSLAEHEVARRAMGLGPAPPAIARLFPALARRQSGHDRVRPSLARAGPFSSRIDVLPP
jgi:hypothetical protein